ncbi:MAG: hypothetical protein OZ921_08055 [Sorangiineae bacterium]|nr:hypothetical protein [Polyangiaceae bacterium]MEB2322451.1 hypothetical protein [Sorangiineae bacterium]
MTTASPLEPERGSPAARAPRVPEPLAVNAGFAGPVDVTRDAAWLARLATSPIARATRNRGGATVTLRLTFTDGARAVFKPEQTHSAGNYRAEIAAYHLDRLLGFGRTAPVAGRRVAREWLRASLAASGADAAWLERFDREVVARDGLVAGAVVAWHEGRLVPVEPPRGWTESVPDELRARVPEWSDLTVFDYLIDNPDRQSGGNVLALGRAGGLIFLDNAAGFTDARARAGFSLEKRLAPLCWFRPETVAALRHSPALGGALERSLASDALAPVLAERHYAALDTRAARVLAHVDECAARGALEPPLTAPAASR